MLEWRRQHGHVDFQTQPKVSAVGDRGYADEGGRYIGAAVGIALRSRVADSAVKSSRTEGEASIFFLPFLFFSSSNRAGGMAWSGNAEQVQGPIRLDSRAHGSRE